VAFDGNDEAFSRAGVSSIVENEAAAARAAITMIASNDGGQRK
jgi:hypothetical protein